MFFSIFLLFVFASVNVFANNEKEIKEFLATTFGIIQKMESLKYDMIIPLTSKRKIHCDYISELYNELHHFSSSINTVNLPPFIKQMHDNTKKQMNEIKKEAIICKKIVDYVNGLDVNVSDVSDVNVSNVSDAEVLNI